MKKLLSGLLVASLSSVAFGESQIFVWKYEEPTFRSFGDSASWTVGDGDATTCPGTEDWIEVSSKNTDQNLTLDNADYAVKGIHWTTWNGDFSRAFTANGFSLSATPADDGKVTLTVKRDPLGAMILVR